MNFNEYLVNLDASMRRELLTEPMCCVAVFQGLSQVDRLLVMRLLGTACHASHLEDIGGMGSDMKDTYANAFRANDGGEKGSSGSDMGASGSGIDRSSARGRVLPVLFKLGQVEWKGSLLVLSKEFGDNLLLGLQGVGKYLDMRVEELRAISRADLWLESKRRWEKMVGSLLKVLIPERFGGSAFGFAKRSVLKVLFEAAKIFPSGENSSSAYRFLLSDIRNQVWTMMRTWLECVVLPARRGEALKFFVYITTVLSPRSTYSGRSLSEFQRDCLGVWSELGLVMEVDGDGSSGFAVSPLAQHIFDSEGGMLAIEGHWNGGMVVETNFYIYCYTDSVVMQCLLELFASLVYRLPNMCVLRLTRASVRKAFRRGLTVDDLIGLLRENKHPVVGRILGERSDFDEEGLFPVNGESGIPIQVETQLRLWEEEKFRYNVYDIFWWRFEDGDTEWHHYEVMKAKAEEAGDLLWSDAEQRSICIKMDAQERLVEYYRKNVK